MSKPAALLAALLAAGAAHAQAPKKSSFEQYEDQHLERALKRHKCARHPAPEGKRIEKIVVETEDIFDLADQSALKVIPIVGIAPRYANYLHTQTRSIVVEREVLFAEGQPYRAALAEETERNLRAIIIFAVARVVPCAGSRPDAVRVVVITKDLWSLRLENDFQFSGGRLDFFRLAVTERNLAGRYKLLSANFGITRDTFSVGQTFLEPRLLGSRVMVLESAEVVLGRGDRGVEGGSGSLVIGQPLYALSSKWGFEVSTDFEVGVTRLFKGNDFFRCFAPPAGGMGVLCDNEIRSAAERDNLLLTRDHVTPIFEARIVNLLAGVVRRLGEEVKHDVGWGYGLRHRSFHLAGDFPNGGFRDVIAAEFLPRSEDATFLYASYRTFLARFRTLRNVAKFAVTEDFQVGHDVRFLVRWANRIFGVDNAFVELDGSAQYRFEIGTENLLTVLTRAQSRGEAGSLLNNRLTFLVNNISPVLGWGRLLFEAWAIFRFDDRDNLRTALGGNQGLRGYDTDEFRGRHAVNIHLEYRTLPIDLATIQVGFVGFYDAGHAADEITQLKLRHSVGFGLRVFLPQINRMSLRIDLGFPFGGGPDSFGRQFSFSYDQFF
jgi:hypothetical protein